MASVEPMETIWIKVEETDEVPTEPDSMVQHYPSSLNIKEELEEGVNQENVTPTGDASDSTRLIRSTGASCAIPFEETIPQGVINDELEIAAEKSAHLSMCGIHTHGLTSQDDSLFRTRYNCSLKKKEFHEFACSFCQQSFLSKYRLITHVFIHIDGLQPPKYVCKSCGEVFSSNVRLKEHLKMSEVDETVSDANNEVSESNDDTENILEDDEISFMQQTSKQFSSQETSKITMTHDDGTQDIHDNRGTLSRTGNVNDHTALLTTKRLHKCDVCGKSFARLHHLKRHLLIHTGIKAHKCDICGKSFTELGTLKKHSLIHSGMRPHKCEICGKSFTEVGNLKKHMLIHTGTTPHKCDICGKSFTEVGNLKKHALIHSGTRKHKCDICYKSFTLFDHLKTHLLIHTGQRDHKCDICGKSFTQLSHLKSHSLIHTGTKPHKCGVCGKSFTRLGALKRHVLIHTGMR